MTESSSSSDAAGAPALHRAIGPKLLLFLVIGDMLGTGIYALTGDVAGVVGGAGWLSFGAAFIVAMFSATSYLELVGKYPRAAGAALYLARGVPQQRAHVLRRVRGDVLGAHFGRRGEPHVRGLFRGVHRRCPRSSWRSRSSWASRRSTSAASRESVKFNVVLTCIEFSGLLIVIAVGFGALGNGVGDAGNALEFNAGGDPFSLVISGATLAFFAIIGFEDSINLVEETKNPRRNFPRAFFIGITITGIVYMLVAFVTTALVPIETLRDTDQDLLEVVRIGARVVSADGVLVHRDVRGHEHVADQSDDGVAAHLRDGERAGRAAGIRRRALGAAHAVGRHHFHDRARARARELGRRAHARRHDGAAAAVRVHDRQRRGARAAPPAGRSRPLSRADDLPDPRLHLVRVSRVAVLGPRRAAIQDRGRAARDRAPCYSS